MGEGEGWSLSGAATSLSFLPVLISVFTVTPDLRPVSEKVRLASKTMCLGHTHLKYPGQGHHQQLAFLPDPFPISTCIFSSFLALHVFWEAQEEVWD